MERPATSRAQAQAGHPTSRLRARWLCEWCGIGMHQQEVLAEPGIANRLEVVLRKAVQETLGEGMNRHRPNG
eukprot:8066486-Alexandrium_andersonii.AAC.1